MARRARQRSPDGDAPRGDAHREDGNPGQGESWPEELLAWYRENRRILPWREKPTPYSTWVSEIMLQQTRVESAIPYYVRFLERSPTLGDLARAPLEEVLALWSGLGYYRRARSLHEGARVVLEQHGGQFPREIDEALSIPGVGPYTAGAVLSIAYNLPVPVVDGNVERVLCRFYRVSGDPRSARNSRQLRTLAADLIPSGKASSFNQALMELGATVCTPLSPLCGRCPIGSGCRTRVRGDAGNFPARAPGRPTVSVLLEAVVLRKGDLYLLEKREGKEFLDGLCLFPFEEIRDIGDPRGRRRAPERPSPVLVSALSRRIGLDVAQASYLGEIRHSITYRRFRVRSFLLDIGRHDRLALPPGFSWKLIEEFGKSVPVSSLAFKIAGLIPR